MRKYLIGLVAVVLTVGFSAFTMKRELPTRQCVRYAIHNGTTAATEKTFASYFFTSTPPTLSCPGSVIVCWFAVPDLNCNGNTEVSEFTARANALDVDGDGRISDDQVEIPGVYQEKL